MENNLLKIFFRKGLDDDPSVFIDMICLNMPQ